ncbi:MAG: elongation factor G [Thermodesulfobacteriaceae bacterium]|nr:elongation factor G [Thermodesulfobacteriaceae bacterium]MCX8041268.1 elongation factor G [Thermodesulfobacteriaceae bacterium]MDW8135427.1 elongation factor G [Thermodesulfobacterium sp.]
MEPKVLAFLGQSEGGKTTLLENLCKLCGESLKSSKKESTTYLKTYGLKYKNIPIYLLDTPGDENFIGEVIWAINAADMGVLVIDASASLKYQVIRAFEIAQEYNLPLAIFINKLDHEKANLNQVLVDLKNNLEISQAHLIQFLGLQNSTPLLVDIIKEQKVIEDGIKLKFEELSENLKSQIKPLKETLIEISAEGKDELLEKYLEEGTLTEEEILEGLKEGIISGKVAPVFMGSAESNWGLISFLNQIIELTPSYKRKLEKENLSVPSIGFIFKNYIDPYAGKLSYGRIYAGKFTSDGMVYTADGQEEKYTQIFIPKGDSLQQTKEVFEGEIIVFAKVEILKTGTTFSSNSIKEAFKVPEMPFTMLTLALHPETRADEDKISAAIAKLKEEDPSLIFRRDEETRELLISGIGKTHIDKTIEKLREKYGVKVKTSVPKIPYRETIRKSVQSVIYRHKKQSGGRGQFAEVHFNLFPLERGKGFEFLETLTGMNVPRNFVPAVEKGVKEAMTKGILAKYPVVDVKVQFYDGKSHEVDSSDLAFQIAAFHCFKKGLEQADPILLEPYLELEIWVPDENVGDVIGDLNARRGRVLSIDKERKYTKIRALAPMAEVQDYVITLHGFTAGRGRFVSRFSHYEEVPPFIAEKIIAEAKAASETSEK